MRESEEYERGHLRDALHLCRGSLEWKIESVVPAKDAEIVLYCGGGNRSALAADSRKRMGYTNVFSLTGGYGALREAGMVGGDAERKGD